MVNLALGSAKMVLAKKLNIYSAKTKIVMAMDINVLTIKAQQALQSAVTVAQRSG